MRPARALLFIALLIPGLSPAWSQAPDPGNEPPSQEEPAGESASAEAAARPTDSFSPRERYNHGLALFAQFDWEGAAAAFLQARDEAGPDAELRYRAAFNLGVALASQADAQQQEKPDEAIATLRRSAAWFQDAIRLGSEGDDDARVNLEIVLRRIQQLADQLNQGNRLEARLERVIDDQRGLRDRIRRLMQDIDARGAGTEPLGFKREFDDLATFERTLLAEVGSISDLAGDERAGLEEKPEAERSDQERARYVQLQNLDHYLQQGRQSLSDARRRLRRLEGERAHRRADSALADLKRAREQLLDPVAVLKGIAQDETELMLHTRGLEALRGGEIRLDDERSASPPPWLNDAHLGERQQELTLRAGEIEARLDAGVSKAEGTGPEQTDAAEQPPDDAAQQRILAAAREAIPFIVQAGGAMQDAGEAIAAQELKRAAESEGRAIEGLLQAIERFAGLRELIELAYGDQSRVVTLLTPPGEDKPPDPRFADLSTAERTGLIASAVAQNGERLGRLEALLEEQRQQDVAQATQGGAAGATPDDASQKLDAIQQRYDLAEELRRKAAASIEMLAGRLGAVSKGAAGGDLRAPAEQALGHLEELRRLFFTIVEHLQQLLREQGETHDQTATVQFEGEEDEERPAHLGRVDQRQTGHASTGEALAEALARQADTAAAAADPQAQQSAEPLANAATEVRGAAGRMRDAGAVLSDAVQYADVRSTDLEPALEDQVAAMEHLENAIRLLQPPSPKQQQGDQQQPQPQQQDDEQMSQRQALRRLQAIRDREAERQRRNREMSKPDPVEKDW